MGTETMVTSTSFRISEAAKNRLSEYAAREQVSATSVLERLIIESLDALEFPGVVHRGPDGDRRAALAAGPDIWEVVSRLRDLDGPEEHRIKELSHESDLHPRQIRLALDYAAAHPEDVSARIARNARLAEDSRRRAEARASLLA